MRTTSLVRRAAIVLACLGWSLPAQAQQTQPFEAWLEELRAEARAAGISEQTLVEALTGVEPVARVIERDRNQAESRLDFWTYVDRVVSDARIEEGQRRLVADGELLDDVAHRYGIPARILVATWGIESSFGRFQGNDGVISSLVTLAYDPRRAAFFPP